MDPDSARFLEVNDAFVRIFGWSREEAIGRHGDGLPIWSPQERDRMMAALREHGGALRDFPCKRLRLFLSCAALLSLAPTQFPG